jgi:putative ABC transport system ATP-binding protein
MSGVPATRIVVEGLAHRYHSPAGEVTVLDGLDLVVEPAAHVALTGASGSGKSTLLCILGGLEVPQQGSVRVGDQDLAGLSRVDLAAFRRETVGFVFQHFGLLEALTAAENVELACALDGVRPAERRRRAAELLEAVDLGDRARHRPVELSGGERQRVAIARALANQPELILADEPTGNLDQASTDRVVALLERLPTDHGCTLVIVTHDPAIAARARRSLRLVDGRLVERPAVGPAVGPNVAAVGATQP